MLAPLFGRSFPRNLTERVEYPIFNHMRERDLRNVGLALILGVTAACAEASPSNPIDGPQGEPVPATEQMRIDTASEATIPGMEISVGAEQRTAEIVPISSQPYYDMLIGSGSWGEGPVESLVPFGIKTGEETRDFVFVPQTVTPEGKALQGEKLLMRDGFKWTNLRVVRNETISWEDPETGNPVLWYLADPAQRGIIGFADLNSDRSTGRGFETPWAKVSPAIQKIIDGETQEKVLLAESEIKPVSEIPITAEFMGVELSYNLIVDESLVPTINEISINPNFRNYKGQSSEEALTEYVARTFFDVWWYKGAVAHTGAYTEEDFTAFMDLWAKAQRGEANWEEVDFKIFANNLRAAGYKQEEVTIRPMSSEEAPEGITAINEFAVVFVDPSKVENITIFKDNVWGFANGTNLDGNRLLIYINGTITANSKAAQLAFFMAAIPHWMRENSGGSVSGNFESGPESSRLRELLLVDVWISAYKVAFKVSPPNEYDLKYNP